MFNVEAELTMRISYLDAWRAIAVACVVLAHLTNNADYAALMAKWQLSALANFGQVGVFIFFFISGYIVSKTCLREVSDRGTFSATAFYVRRVFRIVPPLAIYVACCSLLGFYGVIDFSFFEGFSAMFYLCNIATNPGCGWYAGHTWSLAFEEQFYLLFPILFAWFQFRRRPKAHIVFITIVAALLPLIWPLHYVGRTGFFVIHGLFLIGYVLAKNEYSIQKFIGNAPSMFFWAGLTFTFFPFFLMEQHTAKSLKLIYLVSIPTAVMASSVLSTSFSKLVFENRVLCHLGKISYSIYLWQQLATAPAFRENPSWVLFFALAAVVLFAEFSYRFIEGPLISIGRRYALEIQRRQSFSN